MPELERDPESFDPVSRRLCADGSCIGLIGPDGRCKVCGLADRGGGVTSFPSASAAHDVDVDVEAAAGEAATDESPGGFDAGRKLCVDGSCVGVVGPDGLCGTCGRSAEA